ncbi:terminase [Aneurinibacillus migulanus]|uniref:terminase small subunit n=1 Tax=Aneurinibacillus migulanus TaxID=47500 RepID=UPI0005BAA185|nr:terminase small subunit [Aneurinibacillus migulanus]KPD05322.1 terminase [Aneurinibacillus migulanus]CEH29477.1 PBSX phage terminase small subunit [Aneurinibacillus migulanus]
MNWDEIRKEYETTNITLKELAEKYGIKIGTLKSRKSREGWSRDPTKKDATKNKKVATLKPKDAAKRTEVKEIEAIVEGDYLTEKQRLFCLYYIKTFNATQSAIKAGYAADSAHVEGSRLLRNVKVSAHIRNLKATLTGEIFLEALDVLKKYVEIAFADITDFVTFGQKEREVMGMFGPVVDKEGNPVTEIVNYVEFKDSSMIDGTIITEVKQGKDGISVKLADKMKALDKLSLYFDLFPDQFKRQIEQEKLQIEKERLEVYRQQNAPSKANEATENWVDSLHQIATRRRKLKEGGGNE